jgi:hypothetical protein
LQFVDLARHLLLAGGQQVNAARHLSFSGRDVYTDLVDASPHGVEQYCVETLIGRSTS